MNHNQAEIARKLIGPEPKSAIFQLLIVLIERVSAWVKLPDIASQAG